MKQGDRVEVIGGIWVQPPRHRPIGIIEQIWDDKTQMNPIPETRDQFSVCRVRYDSPPWEDGRHLGTWYADQLKFVPDTAEYILSDVLDDLLDLQLGTLMFHKSDAELEADGFASYVKYILEDARERLNKTKV